LCFNWHSHKPLSKVICMGPAVYCQVTSFCSSFITVLCAYI
jgi:hypothetical protein